ncbi:MAG: UDP-N-acetylmuramoyl-tripeptide--D-alanyl-D-alanine ligase [Clostridiales bacterium]|nr:UDP-N-acetylmuramoyl-tripeptide--D-alanyl-D-alanine ligase [Clostridiales bacterium]
MQYGIFGGIAVVSAVLLTLMARKIMQILQLSSYRANGVFAWFKTTRADYLLRYFAVAFFATACMLVYVGCFGKYKYAAPFGLLFYVLHTVAFLIITARQKNKTPLKNTPRIVRLSVLCALLFGGASFGLLAAGSFTPLKYSLLGVLPALTPFIVLLGHWMLAPFEALNNRRYERRARKKLQSMPELIKVGITGSYGKTTAKNMLAAMLGNDYNVLTTPASFNTPLGIARTVNYELTPAHNVFIAEMGARYRGDVARLCRLVQPQYGIITAVGKQHLATFGSVENIAAAKYELIEGLHEGGVAVFSSDNAVTNEMYARTQGEKLSAGENGAFVSYADVMFDERGTSFTLSSGGKSEQITTQLLGRHVPSLVSVCAAAALRLGVTLGTIAQAVRALPQVEHRLQKIENGDVTILDDAYNSNPEGAKIALEVLGAFSGARMIVTPGLVELGDEEEDANFALGERVYGSADYAYFVGSRAQTLRAGAIAAGMDESKIFVCATLDEAVQKTAEIGGRKTILFANDLPDNL